VPPAFGRRSSHRHGRTAFSRILAPLGAARRCWTATAWLAGVQGVWIIFSIRVVILGILLLTAAQRPDWIGAPSLAIAGSVPGIDTVLLLALVGVFVTALLLGLASLLIVCAAVLRSARTRGREVGERPEQGIAMGCPADPVVEVPTPLTR
jgi:hypothetical protein